MANTAHDIDLDDPIRSIGPDATATFDNSPSNPTERASSNATAEATAAEDDEDDDEEDVEEDEDEDEDDTEDEDALEATEGRVRNTRTSVRLTS